MKKSFVTIAVLIICLFLYAVVVVLPNLAQKNDYEKCAGDSITVKEAERRNYAGNIRDNSTNPKTCGNGSVEFTEFQGNPLLP